MEFRYLFRRRIGICVILSVVSALVLAGLWGGYSVPPVSSPAAEAVQVCVKHGNMVANVPLEEYLIGVVAAEMPADFEPEALRAQAVAARTYTLYCARTGKHADADVCTDFHCCQAWKSDDAMLEGWGETYAEKLSRIRDAVESTAGEYLQFAGQAAFTAFHSSSAGFTEACGAIWSELPYLVSVSSPEDSSSVPNYVSSFSISASTFVSAIPVFDAMTESATGKFCLLYMKKMIFRISLSEKSEKTSASASVFSKYFARPSSGSPMIKQYLLSEFIRALRRRVFYLHRYWLRPRCRHEPVRCQRHGIRRGGLPHDPRPLLSGHGTRVPVINTFIFGTFASAPTACFWRTL